MKHPRSSRQRYRAFVQDYKQGRLHDPAQAGKDGRPPDDSATAGGGGAASGPTDRARRREYLREYLRWLWPHTYAAAPVLGLPPLGAGPPVHQPPSLPFLA